MVETEWNRFLGVILRVPSLFVLDELFRAAFGMAAYYPHWEGEDTSAVKYEVDDENATHSPSVFSNATNASEDASGQHAPKEAMAFLSIAVPFLLSLAFHILAGIAACIIFVLRIQKLKTLYVFVACCVSTFVSYHLNLRLVARVMGSERRVTVVRSLLLLRMGELISSSSPNPLIILTFILQLIQAKIFVYTYRAPCTCNLGNLVQIGAAALVLPAALVSFLPPDHGVISQLPMMCSWTTFCLLNYSLIVGVAGIYRTTLKPGYHWIRRYVRNNSVTTVFQTEWTRLQVPEVLRFFWIMRMIAFSITYFFEKIEAGATWNDAWNVTYPDVDSYLQAVMSHGCDTIVGVLGMSSVVHSVCYTIGSWFHSYLQLDDDEQNSIGVVLSVLFFILAMQTGLTSLPVDKRVVRLCRNFCLVFTALLHFLHRMVNPILQSLSASRTSLGKHLRPLSVAAFLLIVPTSMLAFLWTRFKLSTWLLAVSAFSLEVVVKIVCTLSIYALFVIDSRRNSYWENLDDYVYYIKAVGNGIEFVFGVFLFLNGAWILLFESGGAIRTCMMCIHAYFNIWMEAKNGWDAFIKRRTALGKINSLPDATPAQLSEVDDVCAICYQNMDNAKVTRCGHFFHGNCLRKWLYMQDKCPMCHNVLHAMNDGGNEQDENAGDGDGMAQLEADLQNQLNMNDNRNIPEDEAALERWMDENMPDVPLDEPRHEDLAPVRENDASGVE